MKGHTLIKPLEEDVVIGMGGIIHQTANYKNYKNAIGYSFRFYSTELVKEKKIRHLAINGVQPTRENIINKTYPITNDFLCSYLEKSYKSKYRSSFGLDKSRTGTAFDRRGRIYQFIRGIMLEGVMNNVFMAFSYTKCLLYKKS